MRLEVSSISTISFGIGLRKPSSQCLARGNMNVKPIFHCNAKLLTLGVCIGHYPQHKISHRQNFALGIPTCCYRKTLKFALPPTRTLKFGLPPTPTPNASRWNISGIGPPTRGTGAGHVHFILFVSISFALGSSGIRASFFHLLNYIYTHLQ